jgi:hypothetical protein
MASMKLLFPSLCLSLALVVPHASASIIFEDNFDDGDVSDWVLSSSPSLTTATLVADSSTFVSADYSLEPLLIASPGGDQGNSLFVRASHSFVTAAGDYSLTFSAMSATCGGCTIYYQALVDGTAVTGLPGIFATSFQSNSYNLTGLAAGSHTLTLGMFTTAALNGSFYAHFDDVLITGEAPAETPEPATFLMTGAVALLFGAKILRKAPRS